MISNAISEAFMETSRAAVFSWRVRQVVTTATTRTNQDWARCGGAYRGYDRRPEKPVPDNRPRDGWEDVYNNPGHLALPFHGPTPEALFMEGTHLL